MLAKSIHSSLYGGKNVKMENIPRKTTANNHAGRTMLAEHGYQRTKAANVILHPNWDMN
jgi:hypothetical protein